MRPDPRALADVVQIDRQGATITRDPARLAAARDAFASSHVVVLQSFLSPALLAWTRDATARAAFETKNYDASGPERCMVPNEAIWLLSFLMGAPEVLAFTEHVTGVRPLKTTDLRIYQFVPGTDHHHHWHDDFTHHRVLGLSVNLSGAEFEGGNLQLRDTASGRLWADIRNTGPGDGVVFRLGEDIEHQVLPVTGGHPRTSLAGWFLTA